MIQCVYTMLTQLVDLLIPFMSLYIIFDFLGSMFFGRN